MSEATVGDLGEEAVLARILETLGPSTGALLGPGDDAAVVATPGGSVVATTDTLIEGPDFRLAWSSGFDLGWKAAAVNLADIAAMGATPTALLVALALPRETTVSFVVDLAAGFRDACAALAPSCAVVGGDLATSAQVTVAVTALGDLAGRAPVLRSGARAGDVLAIAGEMGMAGAGIALLFDRFAPEGVAVPVDAAKLGPGERALIDAQLRPMPPVALGVIASLAGATAMLDVSDGLARDASRLATASDVTIDFDQGGLGDDPAMALAGGEDHALLATFPGGDLPSGFRAIGRARPAGAATVTVDGRAIALSGWDALGAGHASRASDTAVSP